MSAVADDFAAIAAGMRQVEVLEEDPVPALYRRYSEAKNGCDTASARAAAQRTALIERFGDPARLHCSAKDIWGHDPAYQEIGATIAESDRLGAIYTDLIGQMMETPATTLAGLLAKMRVGMDTWAPTKSPEDIDFDEEAARAFMADAVRLLAEVLA
jgi:hypothetical protein